MEKRSNHVIPSPAGWAVRKFGAERASKTFATKAKAIQYGRALSKSEKTELYIHKNNGMIQDRNSYSEKTDSLRNIVKNYIETDSIPE